MTADPVKRRILVVDDEMTVGKSISQALACEHLEDFAEMADIEFLPIGSTTDLRQFRNELRWNDAAYRLKG